MKIFRLFTIFIFVSLLTLTLVSNVRAFSSVLGTSIIAPDYQVYIDGFLIEDPNKEILIGTNKPNFFGYTLSNVSVELIIQSEPIVRATTSDDKGYWIYQLDEQLEPGSHTLSLNLTDATGASTSAFLAATFKVPEVLGEAKTSVSTPTPSLRQLNYLTVTLIVFGVALILALIYAIVKRKRSDYE